MKKFLISVLTLFCLISLTISAEAEDLSKDKTLAVIIVGSSDYKTANFVRYAQEYFEVPENVKIMSGSEVQSKYQTYWLKKGLLDEGTPTQSDFIEFVNYSGYDKTIYLVVKDPVLDTHDRKGKQRSRASITINAFLVDSQKIIEVVSSTNEEDSKTSELRAKRGAFKQCIREISKTFNPILNEIFN